MAGERATEGGTARGADLDGATQFAVTDGVVVKDIEVPGPQQPPAGPLVPGPVSPGGPDIVVVPKPTPSEVPPPGPAPPGPTPPGPPPTPTPGPEHVPPPGPEHVPPEQVPPDPGPERVPPEPDTAPDPDPLRVPSEPDPLLVPSEPDPLTTPSVPTAPTEPTGPVAGGGARGQIARRRHCRRTGGTWHPTGAIRRRGRGDRAPRLVPQGLQGVRSGPQPPVRLTARAGRGPSPPAASRRAGRPRPGGCRWLVPRTG